ncbi:hypothetical protein M441DRAFT_29554 [Trichoderma asperellum CBS 433.97]|uniref:Uncharacterized protein n=2 Tax=Trichoderma asperellum TaxID=101201 RepID=A0A2T3Z035_TRIA4|nr:hypothetical protein M441DRAFT_29554 [Trichoderma asperellum CBS 433.97]PTB38157.1 hypothetical protein M441DRAFT_29554 [Trichoderma asperellum CBS 433.97]
MESRGIVKISHTHKQKSFTYKHINQSIIYYYFLLSKQTTIKMFIDDLLYIRAHLSGKNQPKIFSPSGSAASSAAPTPDNRSIASNEKKQKKRLSIFSSSSGSKPSVKAANCGAGMKLPSNITQTKDHSLHYQQIRPIIH